MKFSINLVHNVVFPEPDQPARPKMGGSFPSICFAVIKSLGEFRFVKGSNFDVSMLSKFT